MTRSTRDYAKRTNKQRRNKKTRGYSKAKSAKTNYGLWAFSMVLLFGFVAGITYVFILDKSFFKRRHEPISVVEKTKAKPPVVTAKAETLPEKPRFEFYNILPKLTVQTKKSTSVVKKHHHYDVQVASTRSYKDAEQMRARIILHGLDAHVIRVNTKSGLWYRVALGPYTSSSDAESVLKQLRKNDLDGIIRRLD